MLQYPSRPQTTAEHARCDRPGPHATVERPRVKRRGGSLPVPPLPWRHPYKMASTCDPACRRILTYLDLDSRILLAIYRVVKVRDGPPPHRFAVQLDLVLRYLVSPTRGPHDKAMLDLKRWCRGIDEDPSPAQASLRIPSVIGSGNDSFSFSGAGGLSLLNLLIFPWSH